VQQGKVQAGMVPTGPHDAHDYQATLSRAYQVGLSFSFDSRETLDGPIAGASSLEDSYHTISFASSIFPSASRVQF